MTMMKDERRAAGDRRVPIGTLVEICGNEPGIPAFEAESVDVSARGMHVRTTYLPDVGMPLVCRFEDGGREIVVEGLVAWRHEQEHGGEFGIQFTALDAKSVDALKMLCGLNQTAESDASGEADSEKLIQNQTGTRVRLHIEGLGAPMKARVRAASGRSVQVGSNLEFLKVGRTLEVEDLEHGMKRGASIDSVDVAIDPKTQIPQLVVVLRYEGEESTPEPSVIDSEMHATHRSLSDPVDALPSDDGGASSTDDDADFEHEAEVDEEAEAIRGRVAVVATRAGAAVQKSGAALARFGASAAVGMGRLFKGAAEKVVELRRNRSKNDPPRRTAPAPSGMMPSEGRRLRPQSKAASKADVPDAEPATKSKRTRRIAAGAALAVLIATVGVLALKKPAEPPGASPQNAGPAVAVASANNPMSVDEQGNPAAEGESKAKKVAGAAPAAGAAPSDRSGLSADVPLFGPTPMATMEPAPLGPAPGVENPKAATAPGAATAPHSDEEADELAAAKQSEAADESWKDGTAAKSKAKPEDVEPWGHGQLHTPTIHRMRLDGPGGTIQGAINPTGFTVVIPGRKVMEGGSAIEQRDKRIAKVRTRNGSSGALIAFQFRDGVPGYRVRLRRDYVEFLISAADKTAAVKSSTSSAASTDDAAAKHPPKKATASKSAPKAQSKGTKKKTASKDKAKDG